MENFEDVRNSLSLILNPYGFTFHPFKVILIDWNVTSSDYPRDDEISFDFLYIAHTSQISWYNDLVLKKDKAFRLPYDDDCIAFIVISTPSVFEKAFIPFVRSEHFKNTSSDPLDQCMQYYFNLIKQVIKSFDVLKVNI